MRARLEEPLVYSETMHSWKMQSLQPSLLYIFTRATISPDHQCSQLPYTFCPQAWGSLCSWVSPFDSCRGEVPAPCRRLCFPLTLKELRITIFKTQLITKAPKNHHFGNTDGRKPMLLHNQMYINDKHWTEHITLLICITLQQTHDHQGAPHRLRLDDPFYPRWRPPQRPDNTHRLNFKQICLS